MEKRQNTKPLNMNIDDELLGRVDKFRFQQMFKTRTEAIEFLLNFALLQKPKRDTSEGKK